MIEGGSTAVPEKTFTPNLDPSHPKIDLGKWCQRQRQLYKNTYVTPRARRNFGQLTEEQKGRLDGLGFFKAAAAAAAASS